jgi:hypothetical protein
MTAHAKLAADAAARVVAAETSFLLRLMERAAVDPAADADRLERISMMYERALSREAERIFAAALIKLQRRLPVLDELGEVMDAAGEVLSTYARWEDVVETIRPILHRHGFALTFKPGLSAKGEPLVSGVLRHEAGHKEEAELVLPADVSGGKNPVQAVGSSLTYGQRYVAKMLLNLASRRRGEDDDGVLAGQGASEREAMLELDALAAEAAFPAWKRANRKRLGEMAPAAFHRVIARYNTRLASLRAEGLAA